MVRSSEALFRQRKKRDQHNGGGPGGGPSAVYVTKSALVLAEASSYVRPMFEVAWGPILSVLSQVPPTHRPPHLLTTIQQPGREGGHALLLIWTHEGGARMVEIRNQSTSRTSLLALPPPDACLPVWWWCR